MKRLLIILIFCTVIISIFFLIFFNDEELEPNVAKIINGSKRNIKDEHNAYLAIHGIGYKSSISLHATGRAILDGKESYLSTIDRDNIFDTGSNDLGFCYNPEMPNCGELCCWPDNLIEQIWDNNQEIISQVPSLLTYKDYVELNRNIHTQLLIGLGDAAAITIIYNIINNKTDEAIYAAINSIRFWRMILNKPVGALSHSVLMLNLSRSLSALADILKKVDLNSDQLKNIEQVLHPHKPEESFPIIIEGEILSIYKSGAELKSVDFKLNATLNKLYQVMVKASENIQCGQDQHNDKSSIWFEIYNPMGSILINSRYAKRTFDNDQLLNAKLQIIKTMLEILAGILKPEDLAENDKQAYISDQYTGLPVKFDAKKKEYFINLSNDEWCRAFI